MWRGLRSEESGLVVSGLRGDGERRFWVLCIFDCVDRLVGTEFWGASYGGLQSVGGGVEDGADQVLVLLI